MPPAHVLPSPHPLDSSSATPSLQEPAESSASQDAATATDPRDFPARPFLSTRRLRLRELCLADIPALRALNSNPQVAAHLLEPYPTDYIGLSATILYANVCYLKRPGLGVWHASDMEGRFLGVFALMPIEGTDDVEIGTRLLPETRGRLLPIEGGRALCTHAFDTVGLSHLVGLCDPDNAPIPAILRRLGFSADGETMHFGRRALRFILQRDTWHARSARMQNGGSDGREQERRHD